VLLKAALTGALLLTSAVSTSTTAAASAPVDGYVWASQVNIRAGGSACSANPGRTTCPTVLGKFGPGHVGVNCQKHGETITDAGYKSSYWSLIQTSVPGPRGSFLGGWVSNVYLRGDAVLANVPFC
jgi:hypothetical protein